ncbi:protein kinase [Nonomuraea phyllanthi]|uniref:WD40 repeat domain-containing serine/threonine protein kinase n=1 Tax=Nonomuraea phyllanthi TaxID=2219224 RepID=UPI0012935630|nr:WD40 repeat domain-containing serine/threonine protein kinase [Nonomuraea phyllanthi]QFY10284.1 protein kinase [Nonomuraea phyllanthi]
MESLITVDPQRVGAYWLAGRLGSGGQGVVYDAYDGDGRRVAVKVLHAADHDRILREATAARRVASFCTARVLDVELDGDEPYIVSEYVPGPSLRAAGRVFTGDDLHRLATAIATALTAIHEAGVIHRDLKPDNVLLGPDGPRVIDFGIARTLDMSLTKTGQMSGTPTYMAPEVFTGQRAGAPADVFAWGGIVLFAATGKDPFGADHPGGVMHKVLSHQPDVGVLPARLASLVGAALEKDPASRPAARDLLLALVSGDTADTGGLLRTGSRTAGGLHVSGTGDPALGTIAEDAYGALAPQERDLAVEVFLRMVAVGEDGHESGRWVAREELLAGRPEREAEAIERVLTAFSYVITTKDGQIALSRPALLRAWPRLRMWVDADRGGLAVLNQINAAARHWDEHGRRDGDVLQGSRLEHALRWAATGRRHVTLTPFERDFLQAGTELAKKRARRRSLTTVALAGLLVLALVAGGLAVWQRQQTAAQRDILTARQVAAQADGMRVTDPVKAMLLSVAAWRVSPQSEARSSLMSSLQQPEIAAFRDPVAEGVAYRALSRDGRTLVSVSTEAVNLYDIRTGRRVDGWTELGLTGTISNPPALSPSGRLLAVTTSDELGVWDVRTHGLLLKEKLPQASNGGLHAVFGEHETTLTVAFADDIYRLIDLATGRRFGKGLYEGEGAAVLAQTPLLDPTGRHLLLTGERFDELALPAWTPERRYRACRGNGNAAAFSGDGRVLVCAGDDIVLLDAATGRVHDTADDDWECDICGSGLPELRLSGDGRTLAAFRDRDVRVWDVATHRQLLSYRAEGRLSDVRFDPGGTLRYLLDDTVVGLDLSPRTTVTRTAKGSPALSGDGRWATFLTDGGRLHIWDLRRHKSAGSIDTGQTDAFTSAIDDTGTEVATIDETVKLWDLRTHRQLWSASVPGWSPSVSYVYFSPDGRELSMTAIYGQNPVVRQMVFDTADGHVLHSYKTRVMGGPFTPDGRSYASGDGMLRDVATGRQIGASYGPVVGPAVSRRGIMAGYVDAVGRIKLWSLKGGVVPLRPPLPRSGSAPDLLAFAPDGTVLAAAGGGRVQLWDVTGRRRLGGGFDLSEQSAEALAFSADGATLYAAVDGAVHEMPVDAERVVKAVCARAGRGLTHAEWDEYLGGVPYQEIC